MLIDKKALAQYLLDKGWVPAPYLKYIQTAAKLDASDKVPASKVPCLNPSVCKVSHHRSGSRSSLNCDKMVSTPVEPIETVPTLQPLSIPTLPPTDMLVYVTAQQRKLSLLSRFFPKRR